MHLLLPGVITTTLGFLFLFVTRKYGYIIIANKQFYFSCFFNQRYICYSMSQIVPPHLLWNFTVPPTSPLSTYTILWVQEANLFHYLLFSGILILLLLDIFLIIKIKIFPFTNTTTHPIPTSRIHLTSTSPNTARP